MRIALCLALFMILSLFQAKAGFCDETMTNLRRPEAVAPALTPQLLVPGAVVRLPDGRTTRIAEVAPDGIRTELGVLLTPEGTVQGAAEAGTVTLVEPLAPAASENAPTSPESAVVVPETKPETAQAPENAEAAKAEAQKDPKVVQPAIPDAPVVQVPQQTAPSAPTLPENAPRQLTIVELLPLTPTPDQPKAEKTPARDEPRKAEPVKPEKAKTQKPVQPAKPEEAKKKPQVGEELRIPPEAARTGNLDFLEGCWQGTRPEYYSKRIVKECFCFGAGGGAGKRRVIDPQGGRTCIGSSRAKLSREGVLSVTSSGAACTDGERWGQAEMICKGSGQSTPCSWVFKDAQGGSQAYEIPFVRVESCGR